LGSHDKRFEKAIQKSIETAQEFKIKLIKFKDELIGQDIIIRIIYKKIIIK